MSIELKQLADWHASHACQVRKAAECGTAAENKEPVHGCLLRLADWHDRQSHILRTAIQQAESEPVARPAWWMRETPEGIEWTDVEPWIDGYTPLYTHPATGVPDGYALVPIKPTAEMMRAWNAATSEAAYLTFTERGYDAMLAASPVQKVKV